MTSINNPVAFLKAMLPRIPLIVKTILLHGIGMSSVAGKQDLRTEMTVAIIRSFMDFRRPLRKQQIASMRDPGVQGPIWVSKVTLPQPEDDIQDAVIKAIEALNVGGETFDIPGVGPVEAEWTAYRKGVHKKAPQPEISEEEKYKELRKEAPEDSVILYFHGGAYFMMDPCTHRVPVAQFSKYTGAPVLSVRYRLAPEHPFPSALVDALVSYLSLIHPPPGSLHDPVPANKIILAGDSAGGNLSLVLLQTLLTLRRVSPIIRFHGREVPIDLPAGLATSSPWCDITRSMPSVVNNAYLDYLKPPSQVPETIYRPIPIPEDDLWPRDPPRVDLYCNASATAHPLVSPLAADKSLWKDAPTVFISVGEEGLSDEGLIVARKMYHSGVPVFVEQYEGMPHCFGLLMVSTPVGKRFFNGMTEFMRKAAAGEVGKSSGTGTFVGFKLKDEREIPLDKLVGISDEDALERLRRSTYWRVEGEKELMKLVQEKAKL